ncbi:hypothetical protein [Oceanithermus profundus]|uniref:Uncharacterized protein n=1 Tax=Oceanithermus profundus (strain DSM 14977 / NBRC 100410 / VKM B-2274 / 506) TaxID=670487 RepID=E4U5T9_OCEP5|nr:hypothetical protein [Oceanithermus profundus]ADR35703.1 hypothetical protein Ocepr_0241 [Oceanithermus profundus DSM 14977]
MKNAIRLLVLAGALLSVGAMAQAQQNWNFSFPVYAYVYTNTSSVDFDFTATTTGTVVYAGAAGQASKANLQSCIGSLVTSSLSVTAQNSAPTNPSSLGSCEFGPTSVSTSGYTVNWNGLGSADGSLLVITNSSTYSVTVLADSLPSGVTYKVAPDFGDASGIAFTNIPTGTAAGLATHNDGLYTQYAGVYAIPLTFAADVDPTAPAATTSAVTTLVTYTASAP